MRVDKVALGNALGILARQTAGLQVRDQELVVAGSIAMTRWTYVALTGLLRTANRPVPRAMPWATLLCPVGA